MKTFHTSTIRQQAYHHSQANILQNPIHTSKHVPSCHQGETLTQCVDIANAWFILYLPLSNTTPMTSMHEHVNEWN